MCCPQGNMQHYEQAVDQVTDAMDSMMKALDDTVMDHKESWSYLKRMAQSRWGPSVKIRPRWDRNGLSALPFSLFLIKW